MTMKAHLVHEGEMLFRTKVDGAQEILFDAGDPDARKGPSPMQGVLVAAMACTAADVVSILRKKRVPFTSLEIDAEAERAADPPRVFTTITMRFRVHGTGIHEADVQRAIELSSEKYCSVEAMLRDGSVAFVNAHEILPKG